MSILSGSVLTDQMKARAEGNYSRIQGKVGEGAKEVGNPVLVRVGSPGGAVTW